MNEKTAYEEHYHNSFFWLSSFSVTVEHVIVPRITKKRSYKKYFTCLAVEL